MRQSGLKRMKVNLHRCGAHCEGACGAQRDQRLIRKGYLRTGACCLHASCSSLTWTVRKGVWVCLRLEFDSCIGQVYLMPGCTWGHCLGGTVPPRVATPLTSKAKRQPKCWQPKAELLRGENFFVGFWDYGPVQCRQSYGPDDKGAFCWFLGLRSCPMLTFLRSFLAFVVEGEGFWCPPNSDSPTGLTTSRGLQQKLMCSGRFFRSPASPRAQPRRQTRDWGRVLQFTDVCAHFLTYVVARAVSAASSQDDTATTAHPPSVSPNDACGFPKPLPNTPNTVLECNVCPVREAVRSGGRSLGWKNWLLKKPVTRPRMPKPTSCCSKLRATVGLRPR